EERKFIRVKEPFFLCDLQSQLPQHSRRCFVRTCRHQEQITGCSTGTFERLTNRIRTGSLQRRALHSSVGASRPHQSGRAQLLRLLDDLVEFPARVLGRARYDKASDFAAARNRAAENRELRCAKWGRNIFYLHATSKIRFVRTVFRNRVSIWQTEERSWSVLPNERHQALH